MGDSTVPYVPVTEANRKHGPYNRRYYGRDVVLLVEERDRLRQTMRYHQHRLASLADQLQAIIFELRAPLSLEPPLTGPSLTGPN
jgi:hypothetical protein